MIKRFLGPYHFLSNFYPVSIEWNGHDWKTVEHAFQAAKTVDPMEHRMIHRAATPGEAKRLGRRVTLRRDWELVKQEIMLKLLRRKFNYSELARLLVETYPEVLVEGNDWGDTYWGAVVDHTGGVHGQNHLGRLLMQVRAELIQGEQQ